MKKILLVLLLLPNLFVIGQTQVSVFNYPNLNGSGGCSDENENLISIIDAIPSYAVDGTITSFANSVLLGTQLDASEFFFMTDMESQDPNNTTFLPIASRAVIENWVNTGGVMVMTGTFGSKDSDFLNLIFSWDLTTVSGTSWAENTANTAGTPFAGLGVPSLPNLSATDAISSGTVPNFIPMWGVSSNAVVAVIEHGSGYVIFLGYDFYNTGVGCPQYTSDWVQIVIPAALDYATALASSSVTNITYTSGDYTYAFTESGTSSYILVPGGSVAPTDVQIAAGVDYGAVTVLSTSTVSSAANIDDIFSLTGLTHNTTYDIYAVTNYFDGTSNVYGAIEMVSFTTLDNDLPVGSAIADQSECVNGSVSGLSITLSDAHPGDNIYTVTASSSNTGVVANGDIIITGSGSSRSIAITPIASASGTSTITLTITDSEGGAGTQTFDVTFDDLIDPTVLTNNLTIQLDATGNASITPAQIDNGSTDNCTIASYSLDILSFTCTDVGPNTVTLSVTDEKGNIGTNTAIVTVQDVTNPDSPVLSDLTAECSLTAVAPTTTDVCAGTVTGTTSDPLTYSAQGSYVINWTFDDGNGNSIIVAQNVIIADVSDPATPVLADITEECSGTAVAPTTTDNCSGTLTGTTSDPLSYSTQGSYVINWTFDDGNGNSIVVAQNVIVADVSDPATPVLADITSECSATAVAPTTTDNCSGTLTGTTSDPLAYSTQGSYVINWTFDDGNGNSIVVAQNVIIADVSDPATLVLADVTDECSATVSVPTTSDNCSGTVTGTTSDPLSYSAQGSYVINWTFDDGNGNSIVVAQNVIIADLSDPATLVLADVTDECSATVSAPTTSDNCSGTVIGTTSDPLSYSAQGSYVINWTFDDGNGNSIVVAQNVIIADVSDPATPILADVTGECSATAVAPTTTDNCSGVLTGTTSDPLTYSAQGSYVINWTFDDGNGNSIVVTQNVIVDDISDPTTPILADVTGECSATAVASTTSDNCSGTITGTTSDPLTYSTQGSYVINWTFDDGNGNSIIVPQNVIVDDVTNPVLVCSGDIVADNVPTNCGKVVNYALPTFTDNCSGATMTQTDGSGYGTGDLFPVGTTYQEYTVIDAGGNIVTCGFNVTINDNEFPQITNCPTDVTVYLGPNDCNGIALWSTPVASDNCPGVTIASSHLSGDAFPAGTTTVSYDAVDNSGNITVCSFDVIVIDTIAPAPPVINDVEAVCSVIELIAPIAADNCGDITATTNTVFPISTIGSTDVIWTWDDGNGNVVVDTQVVTISTVDVSITVSIPTITANNSSADSYQWIDVSNGNSVLPGETNQSFTASINGEYAVIVWQGGCSDTSMTALITTIGMDELTDESIVVYPNPIVNGEFKIDYNGVINSVKVIDIVGRVLPLSVNDNGQVDCSELSMGKYIVQIVTEKSIITREIVILK